jgi:hypothetical protein
MALGFMSIEVRKHNESVRNPLWWRRYFWSRHEFWAKHAVHRSARRAQHSYITADGRYFFWHHVSLRAAEFCESSFGSVPQQLLSRPFGRGAWALSSSEISQWLRVPPPYKAQQGTPEDAFKATRL